MKTSNLNDFPDALSPMLVKELRQGLRARIFTAVFLGMQLLLGLLLLGAMLASDSERIGSIVSGIILTFFTIAVVLIQPLRGIGALSGEMRDQTIDLMALTRLTSWRIVLGKWVAIVSQSALLLCTIIPYLILRYFFGGMNLLGEITIFICLFAASMALTAFTVGLSACRMAIARVLIPVALVIIMFFSLIGITIRMSIGGSTGGLFSGSLSTADNVTSILILFAAFAYLAHQSLSMGASLIAPAAENHAMARRLVSLIAVIATGVATYVFHGYNTEILWFLLLPLIALPAIAIALSETSNVAPGLVNKFKKRGFIGRQGAIFLLPGRASGYFFTLLVVGLMLVILILRFIADYDFVSEGFIRLLGFWGTLLFPAVVLHFVHRGDGQLIGSYLLILFSTMVFWLIVQTFAQVAGGSSMMLFVWCPIVFTLGDVDAFDSPQGIILIVGVMIVFNGILAKRAVRDLRALLKTGNPPPSQLP